MVVYTDGSGGRRTDELTRAAWRAAVGQGGIAEQRLSPPPVAFLSVPGVQHAQRAEVWGAARAIDLFGPMAASSICVVTDSAYLVGGAQAEFGRQTNKDVWAALARAVRACDVAGCA